MSKIKDTLKAFAEKYSATLKAHGIKLEGVETQVEMKVVGKLADGTEVRSSADSIAEGVDLFIVDAEGKEIPAPVGEHTLEDGSIVVVETEGIVKSISAKMDDEMTAEQIQQNMDTLMGKLEELSVENESLKAENESLKSGKTASEDEVKQLKAEVLKLKKQPAATSVKEEKQKKEETKDDDVKVGSREYFKRITEKANKN